MFQYKQSEELVGVRVVLKAATAVLKVTAVVELKVIIVALRVTVAVGEGGDGRVVDER